MKMKRILASIFACVVSLTAFASCKDGTGSSSSDATNTEVSAKNPIGVDTEHYQDKTLHKVKVTETNRPFVQNGESEYVILYEDGQMEARAACALISKQVAAATGCNIPVESTADIAWSETAKYIVLGREELFEAAGLTMPEDELGPAGYYIKTCGESVFIEVNSIFGYQQAAITFLRHVVGYEMYSEDTVVFYKTGETLPDMDIVERPDFGYRVQGNKVSNETNYNMGFINNQDIIIPVTTSVSNHNGYFHNSLNYFDSTETNLNPELLKAHPNWFSTGGAELCYTARGDEKELELMVNHVVERMKLAVDKYSDMNVVTFTIQDNYDTCKCASCQELMNTYKTAAAGNIRFVNKVADKIDAWLTEKAETEGTKKRELIITVFGYHLTTNPPVKEVDGKYEPIDETVRCRDNVGVFVAPIEASFTHSFYDEVNKTYANIVEGWGAISNHIFAWLYEPNYSHYLYPFNTYDSTLETMRFCVANNALYVWTEGQSLQYNPPGFNKFKEYFNSKAEFDVNVNYDDLVEGFFANYFAEAQAPMKQFFNEVQMWCRHIENMDPTINGTIYENIAQAKFWPKKTLDHWMDLIDEAYAAIEPLKYTESDRYAVLARHIKNESIFPRFALLTLYPGNYSAATLQQMRVDFKADCTELNIKWQSQNVSLDMLYTQWGI